MDSNLNQYSDFLIKTFEKKVLRTSEKGLRVNPIVSELATWYEKFRNAIEYREEEVILRASIERIIKRRLLLGGSGKSVAGPLVRELTWARYFPDGSIEEPTIEKIEKTVDLYLKLRTQTLSKHKIRETLLNKWIYQLMSSEIEHVLTNNIEKETVSNYIFHILRNNVKITDDNDDVRDVQVFIAIRKAYAKDDLAFLHFNLFQQYFGELNDESVENISDKFLEGYKEIEAQLNYPARYKIYSYVKRQIPPFLILEDILRNTKEKFIELAKNDDEFQTIVYDACQARYNNIIAKVKRAIIRSVIFILLSKVFLAFTIEGTYERFVYGGIQWLNIGINIAVPTILMIASSLFIRTPGKDNSARILDRIRILLFDPNPQIGRPIFVKHKPQKSKSLLENIFSVLWFATFFLSFGAIMYVLSKLHFNLVSQGFFLFFLTIVSFLSYRINQTAHLYTVADKQGLLTPLVDFFFMPIARIGRYLTEGISQLNILLFVLDLIIEAPFKALVAFFDQWFHFLHAKREDLG